MQTIHDRKALLSTLWVFVLLNMLFRDIHEIFRPGAMEEYMSLTVSEGAFLAAAFGLELMIGMVVLSRVLPRRANRWANIGVSLVTLAAFSANLPRDLDDVAFMTFEVIGLAAIIWLAWSWPQSAPQQQSQERLTTQAV